MGKDVFGESGMPSCTLHITKGSKNIYSSTDQWNKFTNTIEDLDNTETKYEIKIIIESNSVYNVLKYTKGRKFNLSTLANEDNEISSIKLDGVEQLIDSGIEFVLTKNHTIIITPKSK